MKLTGALVWPQPRWKEKVTYVQAPAQQNHSWGGGGDRYRVQEATARSKSWSKWWTPDHRWSLKLNIAACEPMTAAKTRQPVQPWMHGVLHRPVYFLFFGIPKQDMLFGERMYKIYRKDTKWHPTVCRDDISMNPWLQFRIENRRKGHRFGTYFETKFLSNNPSSSNILSHTISLYVSTRPIGMLCQQYFLGSPLVVHSCNKCDAEGFSSSIWV